MSKIKLVVSDIDGTILDDNHQLDHELKDVLKELQAEGIHFVLSSARSPQTMYDIAADLGVESQPLACYNGGLILKEGNPENYQPIFSHELVREEALRIFKFIEENYPDLSINLYTEESWYVNKYDKWSTLETSITGEEPVKRDLAKLVADPKLPIHKFLLIGEIEEIQSLFKDLDELTLETSAHYLSKENYMEITHQEISKEKSLIELAEYYDIPLENTLAIGDNFNDLPMLLLAGVGVAMANGPDEVKEQADEVTRSNNNNGAAQALRKYVLGKR